MRLRTINLASQPFINLRPIRRVAAVLWVLGGALLAVNAALYWRTVTGSEEKSDQLVSVEQDIAQEIQRIRELEAQLGGLELAEQNELVEFLNSKIAQRTFSWSQLFDHVAEVMPKDVRLTSLTPQIAQPKSLRRRSSRTERDERVVLEVVGAAKTDEALLAFVDALFEHPAFDQPNLEREARDNERLIRFNLRVIYGAGPSGGLEPTAGSQQPAPQSPPEPAPRPDSPPPDSEAAGPARESRGRDLPDPEDAA